jgi:hypothetical protein
MKAREIVIKLKFDEKEWSDYNDTSDDYLLLDSGIDDLKLGVSYEVVEHSEIHKQL